MSVFSKEFLSGTPASGRPIAIAAIATPGTLIHTAHATAKDEIWLYVANGATLNRFLTIEFGGVAAGDQIGQPQGLLIPGQSTVLVIAGVPISGGLLVRGFVDVAGDVDAFGWVNRIT